MFAIHQDYSLEKMTSSFDLFMPPFDRIICICTDYPVFEMNCNSVSGMRTRAQIHEQGLSVLHAIFP